MKSQQKAVANYRRRLKRRGIARLEVRVPKADVPLVRGIAEDLADPARASDTRALLKQRLNAKKPTNLKALLAAMPLDIELERDRDTGRDIDF